MKAYVFPGQGAQYPGMGKDLFENNETARNLFLRADEILGFRLTDIMFSGSEEDLKQTQVTQPAIFIHSVTLVKSLEGGLSADMVAGHSLGEFSALVANGALSFEDGVKLVARRAMAMQKACEISPSTMAAILGLEDGVIEEVCREVDGIVVPANYNCPGQVVISGTVEGVEEAMRRLQERGAKRAVKLMVGGAFHSPLMDPARQELQQAIEKTTFSTPLCPVYQNATALPTTDPDIIRKNLIDQLTAPVRWTQSVRNMISDGAAEFLEAGPGKVLQGLIRKISRDVQAGSVVAEF